MFQTPTPHVSNKGSKIHTIWTSPINRIWKDDALNRILVIGEKLFWAKVACRSCFGYPVDTTFWCTIDEYAKCTINHLIDSFKFFFLIVLFDQTLWTIFLFFRKIKKILRNLTWYFFYTIRRDSFTCFY
jgi:hypothetical protein